MRILLLVLLLLIPVLADDQADIARQVKTAWGRMTAFRQAGDYALVDWEQGESGGQALLRKVDGRWWILTGGGGAMDGGNLWELGVPEAAIKKLMKQPTRLAEAKAAGPQWTWLTQQKDLTDQDLETYGAFELTLMRNEIFAVHGRVFKDPVLAGFFKSRPWYRPDPAFSDSLLTERERKNAAFISSYQARTKKQF